MGNRALHAIIISSLITVVNFASSSDRAAREWSQSLPDGEIVTCCALGGDYVLVTTSRNLLRTFTLNGHQLMVDTAAGGQIVTACAHKNQYAVVVQTGVSVLDADEQTYVAHMRAMLVTLDRNWLRRTTVVVDVPMSANAKLTWAGYSRQGNLVVVDSAGEWRSLSSCENL